MKRIDTMKFLLQNVPLFKELTEVEIEPISEMAYPREFKVGEIYSCKGIRLIECFLSMKGE